MTLLHATIQGPKLMEVWPSSICAFQDHAQGRCLSTHRKGKGAWRSFRGRFLWDGLEAACSSSTPIALAGPESWPFLTARDAGKCSLVSELRFVCKREVPMASTPRTVGED